MISSDDHSKSYRLPVNFKNVTAKEELSLNKDHPLNSRKTKRHNHVFIRLKIKTKNDWVWIKAQNWSETGFSFNFDFNLEESEAQFRKGKAIIY